MIVLRIYSSAWKVSLLISAIAISLGACASLQDKKSATSYFEEGASLVQRGKYDEAIENYRKGLRKEHETDIVSEKILYGNIKRFPVNNNEFVNVEITPTRKFDFGHGEGKPVNIKVEGGLLGLIIDSRGRPLCMPQKKEDRNNRLIKWNDSIGAYNPNTFMELDELVKYQNG